MKKGSHNEIVSVNKRIYEVWFVIQSHLTVLLGIEDGYCLGFKIQRNNSLRPSECSCTKIQRIPALTKLRSFFSGNIQLIRSPEISMQEINIVALAEEPFLGKQLRTRREILQTKESKSNQTK